MAAFAVDGGAMAIGVRKGPEMLRILQIALILGAGLGLLSAPAPGRQSAPPASAPTTRPANDPQRWKADIAAFTALDAKNTPPADALLFVGSSSIVHWETARAFPEWRVINRGFGGSITADVTYYAADVIVKYRPRAIVFYSGDNDVASGLSAEQVAGDFAALLQRIRKDLPQTPVIVLSIKPSRSRWALWPVMKDANARIAAIGKTDRNFSFVDVGTVLLNERGEPRLELYESDQLHLNAAGYAAWNRVVTPVLKQVLSASQGDKR